MILENAIIATIVSLVTFMWMLGSSARVSTWLTGIDFKSPVTPSPRALIAFTAAFIIGVVLDINFTVQLWNAVNAGWVA